MTIFVKALKIVSIKKCINCCYFLVLISHFQAPRQLRYSGNVLKAKLDNAVQMVATVFLPTGHKQQVQVNSQNGMTFHLPSGTAEIRSKSPLPLPLQMKLGKTSLSKCLAKLLSTLGVKQKHLYAFLPVPHPRNKAMGLSEMQYT